MVRPLYNSIVNYTPKVSFAQRIYSANVYLQTQRANNSISQAYGAVGSPLYRQSPAYRLMVQKQAAQATRERAMVRIKVICDMASKSWQGTKSYETEFEKKYGFKVDDYSKYKIAKHEVLFLPDGGAIGLLGKSKNVLDWTRNAVGAAKIFASVNDALGDLDDSKDKFNPKNGTKIKRGNSNAKKDTGYVQDDGTVWSPDDGANHGGSSWKKYKNKRDFEKGKREGTYDENGNRLRD